MSFPPSFLRLQQRQHETKLISEHHCDSVNVMFYILLAVCVQVEKREPLMMWLIKLSCANTDASCFYCGRRFPFRNMSINHRDWLRSFNTVIGSGVKCQANFKKFVQWISWIFFSHKIDTDSNFAADLNFWLNFRVFYFTSNLKLYFVSQFSCRMTKDHPREWGIKKREAWIEKCPETRTQNFVIF